VPVAEVDFSASEEQTTLLIGAIVFALLLSGLLAFVLWRAGSGRGRWRTRSADERAATGLYLSLLGAGVVVLGGPLLLLGLLVGGGILVGIATILGASLLLATLLVAGLILLIAALWGWRDLARLRDEQAQSDAGRFSRFERELARRVREVPRRHG
jgi:hypothetical protein